MKNINTKKGFSLMELVVVTAIVAILTTLTVYTLTTIRKSNRDSERLSDISALQIALSEYYRDNGSYPEFATELETSYLTDVPTNPTPTGDCPGDGYVYSPSSDYASYSIRFCLEERAGEVAAGTSHAIPGHILTCIPNCVMSCDDGSGNVSDGCGGTCSNTITCPSGYSCINDHCISGDD